MATHTGRKVRTRSVTADELKNGEPDAFARLFEQNRDKLLAVAYRLTSSQAEANDAVQDAFVSILVHHRQFQGTAQPSTWAYRVTVNAALMRMRSSRRKRAESLDALPQDLAEQRVHDARCDDGDEVVADPDRAERKAAVAAALAGLPEIDRRIVELRLKDDLSTEEVSARTGLTASAVKTRLHRARARLKDSDLAFVVAE